jgi:surface-anchored protein
MRRSLFGWTLGMLLTAFVSPASAELVYISGHADIGVELHEGELELHVHAEGDLGLYGGGVLGAGEYGSRDLVIGVPGPSVARPVGSQWDFVGNAAGAPIWFLPQSEDVEKPFLGVGSEDLAPLEWSTDLTWQFDSISTVAGADAHFSLWRFSTLGELIAVASSSSPINGNEFDLPVGGHEHFNFGFTAEGIYDVVFSVAGTHNTLGTISDTATFRFATGRFIPIAVPEPSGLLVLGLVGGLGAMARRQRKL